MLRTLYSRVGRGTASEARASAPARPDDQFDSSDYYINPDIDFLTQPVQSFEITKITNLRHGFSKLERREQQIVSTQSELVDCYSSSFGAKICRPLNVVL